MTKQQYDKLVLDLTALVVKQEDTSISVAISLVEEVLQKNGISKLGVPLSEYREKLSNPYDKIIKHRDGTQTRIISDPPDSELEPEIEHVSCAICKRRLPLPFEKKNFNTCQCNQLNWKREPSPDPNIVYGTPPNERFKSRLFHEGKNLDVTS